MLHRVLIANRGEIALRIIRACKALNYTSIFLYSAETDVVLERHLADEAYEVPKASPFDCYNNPQTIFAACEQYSIDAIHPGYGFLAENAEFAESCERRGIVFIGSSAETLRLAGDKVAAKGVAEKLGIPVLPYTQAINFAEELTSKKVSIPFPALLKATTGGGGHGMRKVNDLQEAVKQFSHVRNEVDRFFGGGSIYLESCLGSTRHIEVQVARDSSGRCIWFPERDCSLQRRHQKLLEETPAPNLSPVVRQELREAACACAEAIHLVGVATIEFLVGPQERYYFLEINPRIQVEHGITELVTGVDIVRLQMTLAEGHPLLYSQTDITCHGHALQCRIITEDPFHDFSPSYGIVSSYKVPGGLGVRVDDAVYAGMSIQPFYDGLIAKCMAHATSRHQAIERMNIALQEYVIEGVSTTIPLFLAVLSAQPFHRGGYTTDFLQQYAIMASMVPPKISETLPHKQQGANEEMVAHIVASVVAEFSEQAPEKKTPHHSPWKLHEEF